MSLLFDGEHGHGFIEATSMNEAGYSVEYYALEIEIILSSNGCRITSNTFLENSGNSSKWKKWYHCNSLIARHKAPKMTKICTIKIVAFLAKVKKIGEICTLNVNNY